VRTRRKARGMTVEPRTAALPELHPTPSPGGPACARRV
jgi:hypothetical protein